MFSWFIKIFKIKKKDKITASLECQSNYSDFDYESLCELYYKNKWLRHEVNNEGLKNLWLEYDDLKSKKIIYSLLKNFKYVFQEDAALDVKNKLTKCIADWNLSPDNTLLIGFRKHNYPDGSQIILNFIKSILIEINPKWQEYNLLPDFHYGIKRIKKNGFPRNGVDLKNIVLVDDFIGTGGTAKTNIQHLKKLISDMSKDFSLNLFALAAMKTGIKLLKPLESNISVCYELDKASKTIWPYLERKSIRKKIVNMEKILYEGVEPEKLEKFSLGYGKSEAIFAWNRFNLPNNNFPIFWWNRYSDGKSRKPLFNRMQ
ncbi:phosphoribosyltransferase [Psychroflexus sp. CAK8W]|uniref:Phosphoribosyltransferase n=1 Tax=Psychroflexus longus TaxID=2873596 RepID=A0ABS7XHM2_9FLAO|nr:phosphoribosyltransferase [Psychroflexus longus]MBZ9778451.1 phosphoribosyltransferase [Psychroflexus longus]